MNQEINILNLTLYQLYYEHCSTRLLIVNHAVKTENQPEVSLLIKCVLLGHVLIMRNQSSSLISACCAHSSSASLYYCDC